MVGSESKPRILRIPVHVSLHSAHVILSLPESLSSLCTALYPAAAAAAKRAVHASQFWPPFLNSNQICCLLLSIRRYDRGRDRGERPFFFGGPKSKAPLPLPLRCSVSALRLSPAPPLQILVACCLVSHCGSMIFLLCVVKTAGWRDCPK